MWTVEQKRYKNLEENRSELIEWANWVECVGGTPIGAEALMKSEEDLWVN